jgi:hypothetical protein
MFKQESSPCGSELKCFCAHPPISASWHGMGQGDSQCLTYRARKPLYSSIAVVFRPLRLDSKQRRHAEVVHHSADLTGAFFTIQVISLHGRRPSLVRA